jgi:hypothetical protein
MNIGCSKFYNQYQRDDGLTGGIMALWCTHGICLGFHCIPLGKGWNDVFLALLTRWKVAPRYVIYDFACALAPYCMTQEPDFFKNTVFLIDNFHAAGHTKCSAACFLTTYARHNLLLESVNSSAGESGNGALNRIRTSLKYMSQERAIVYLKVFLSIWNRVKRNKMTTA